MSLARKIEMEIDSRSHERKNLAYDQIPGNFKIEYAGNKCSFSQVNDVSISGMGILLEALDIPAESPVVISYESDDFCVAINAKVIWNEKLSGDVFRMGVQFSSENMDDNVMLFMTLREYIDDFGEAF